MNDDFPPVVAPKVTVPEKAPEPFTLPSGLVVPAGVVRWQRYQVPLPSELLAESIPPPPLPPDAYYSSHRVAYVPPHHQGDISMPVLHFLWGQPWDQLALNFVHAVQPSCIRVTTGACTADAVRQRVTVYVTADNRTIVKIKQEVTVGVEGLTDACGYDLKCALRERLPDGVDTIPAKPAW